MSPSRPYFEGSEEELDSQQDAANRKRSSRACDQCRKTKSKCERPLDDNAPCKTCVLNNTQCTFLGPSYKRGPPKGYIHAIEQRWHHVESILGAIIASSDPRAQGVLNDLRRDELAREILNRVDAGPFGTIGRAHHPGRTKENYFENMLNGGRDGQGSNSRAGRSRRESRVSREIVSSNQDLAPLPSPSSEWQDRLAASLGPTSGYASSNSSNYGNPTNRRRLDGPSADYNWDGMYTMDSSDGGGTDRDETDAVAEREDNATAMGQLSLDENREIRFHGKASGLHLLHTRGNDRKEGGIWKFPMTGVWPPSNIRPARLIDEEDINVTLPLQHEQDMLVQLYFIYVHPAFPIIHKARFLAEYEAKKADSPVSDGRSRSGSPVQQVSKVLLLSMFSLAARYLDQPTSEGLGRKMWEIGCNYALDAREIINKIYHHSRLPTCQALLLLGMHEHAIGSMEHAWLFIGMGVRMAEDLGLNRAAEKWQYNGEDLFTPVELQVRRAVWYGCCMADTFVSVYMGRPVSIAKNDFDTTLPEVTDDDCELWQPHAFEPTMAKYHPVPGRVMLCYREAIRLVFIVAEIVRRIYPVKPAGRDMRRALADLEKELDHWYIDLSETLRFDLASKRTTPPPHVLLLHVRYWSAVLLLHRAFIPRQRGPLTSRNVTDNDTVSLKAFDICQSAASHISTIVSLYDEHFGMKRSPLFMSSYVLSAGIMHVVTLNLRENNVQATLGLRQCLAALEKMEVIWPSASRAKDLLNGANVQYQGIITPLANGQERHKRPADDGLGDDKTSELLQREAFGAVDTKVPTPPGAQADQRIMAHMLGLDIPGVQASTSYFPGYEWWPSIQVQQTSAAVPGLHHSQPSQVSQQQHHALQTHQQPVSHSEAQPRMQPGSLPPMMVAAAQGAGQQTPMQHNWMATASPVRGYGYENGLNGYTYGR